MSEIKELIKGDMQKQIEQLERELASLIDHNTDLISINNDRKNTLAKRDEQLATANTRIAELEILLNDAHAHISALESEAKG